MATLTQTAPALAAPAPARGIVDALLRTDRSYVSTILRLTLALVIFPHGAQKLLGWFGGYGFEGTMGYFTGTLGVPAPIALLVILGEVFMAHLPNGCFMNWSGDQAGEGFEYHLLVLGMTAALAWAGGGAASIDRWLHARLGRS